jgi:hypothetical protein
MGPYIGIVVNNIDNTRSGRLQVYIDQFGATDKEGLPNLTDPSLWRTVSYCPPFYGATPKGGSAGVGSYLQGNQQSYGMWFTPPDLGTQVLCFFVAGDPTQGYYVGCLPEPGINHMIPAIGAVTRNKAATQNQNQEAYFANASLLPVTEINNAISNPETNNNPRFFDQPKPVHSYVAGILFQQGLINDPVRGPIASSSQRESPSACYGISTPGRAVYQGGLGDQGARQELERQTPEDIKVIGRRGGHTLVMDDGSIEGSDNLVRIRTSKGHQITMSDDGNCFYITHANGQSWIELGEEGTLDVFSTNSVNIRTEGTINLHADQDINMYAGNKINMKSAKAFTLQSDETVSVASKNAITLYSEDRIGVKSNGSLALVSKGGAWDAGNNLSLSAGTIDLQGGAKLPVDTPAGLTTYLMPDATFNSSLGWQVEANALESIVTRAPTHEPWPYHNKGVGVTVKLEEGQPSPPPAAPTVPSGVTITKTADPPAQTETTVPATPAATQSNTARPTREELNAAQDDMLTKQNEYERLKGEFGILDPRTEAAFAEYKAALARFQKLAGTNF